MAARCSNDFALLLMCNSKRMLKIRFRFRRVSLWRQQCNFSGYSINITLNHLSFVVSIAAIASPRQRLASLN